MDERNNNIFLGKAEKEYHIIIEVCGVKQALTDHLPLLKPGGTLLLVGLCHPNSAIDVTAEKIIRNCWTIMGKFLFAQIVANPADKT